MGGKRVVIENGNDDSSSIASFEDISASKPGVEQTHMTSPTDLVVSKLGSKEFQNGEVPEVLYVVQIRDQKGNLLETRQSDTPIAAPQENSDEEVADNQKPVIEIVTRITVSNTAYSGKKVVREERKNTYNDDFSDYSDSDSCSGSDDDEMPKSKGNTSVMIMHSRHLKNAMSAVVGYYPRADFVSDRVVIPAPYHVLFHHRDALSNYKYSQPACHSRGYKDTTVKHIDILLSFLDKTYGETIRDEERRHQNNPPAATFAWLWLLLKPGEVIYTKKFNSWTPFIISQVVPVYTMNRQMEKYEIYCWNMTFRGGKIARNMHTVSVRTFSGEQAINSLPLIPAKFFPEELENQGGKPMAERQIELGKLYWELMQRPAYKDYEGPLLAKDNCPANYTSGRIIVDAEGYERNRPMAPELMRMPHPPRPGFPRPPPRDHLPAFSPRCSCSICSVQSREQTGQFSNFEDLDPKTSERPTNDLYYLVCATNVPAFILSDRRWGHVNLDGLKEVKVDREAFKYLVLDDDIKLTVKALIGKFASEDGKVSPWPRDIIKNKGEGRIFLLHGTPGVGKTCTAECVAELAHRPLLSLTSGDISSDMSAVSVERNLNYYLNLGERYGALVLLDEADVFLEERRPKDLTRNGLVSIFLRALEYYRGVLFLTTNRVEAFDSAFTSRIHVALHFHKLKDHDRLRIWNNNLERLERDSNGKVYVSNSTREFVYDNEDVRALRWNGREIRNAMQTAVALAETEALEDGSDKVNVTEQHLRAVVKMSKGFKDYMRRRRGWAEGDSDSEDEEEEDDDNDSSIMDD